GAQYDLSDNANVYGTVSKGFKVGGFNPYACNNVFEPEKLTAYEIGFKTRLLDRSLTLNASAFYYDYTDLQLNQVVGLAILIKNAPAAEIKGLEVEAAWQPDDHWTFNGNISLLDATYTKFSNVDSLAPQLGLQDVSGNSLNDAPKRSANAGVAYRTDPFSFGSLTARVDLSYRSTFYFREFNNPLDAQEAYTLVNLGLIWDSPDEKYRVRLYGNNITNEAHINRMSSTDQLGARFVNWGAPRQFGVELKANF
ncbi:MAG: TonB-dependent receptor, partial [Brevundimonas sp.]